MQIHEEARKFSYQTGVKVVVAYGGAPIHQQVIDLLATAHLDLTTLCIVAFVMHIVLVVRTAFWLYPLSMCK